MQFRTVFSGFVALGCALVVMPLGCGGAQEDYVPRSRASTSTPTPLPMATHREADVPETTVRQWKDCVERGASRLTESSYALQYDAVVNERGEVVTVKLRDATLHDREIEGCLRDAIQAMSVPVDAFRVRSSRPFSGGERMNREQRGPVGIAQALGGVVALGPVLVVVGAVAVAVVVTVGVVDTIEAISKLERIERHCLRLQNVCLMHPKQPPERWSTWGEYKDCGACFRECKHEQGTWPDYKCPLTN